MLSTPKEAPSNIVTPSNMTDRKEVRHNNLNQKWNTSLTDLHGQIFSLFWMSFNVYVIQKFVFVCLLKITARKLNTTWRYYFEKILFIISFAINYYLISIKWFADLTSQNKGVFVNILLQQNDFIYW